MNPNKALKRGLLPLFWTDKRQNSGNEEQNITSLRLFWTNKRQISGNEEQNIASLRQTIGFTGF